MREAHAAEYPPLHVGGCEMSHLGCWRLVQQASVVQKMDSATYQINLYPLDSAIGFPNTCPLDGDLSGG